MRASDKILHDDLKDAGLQDLALRAGRGEWNDYFGPHATPQHHLTETLIARMRRAEKKGNHTLAAAVTRILLDIPEGKYDGTKAEADEWSKTPEGAESMEALNDPRVQEQLERLKELDRNGKMDAAIEGFKKQHARRVLS